MELTLLELGHAGVMDGVGAALQSVHAAAALADEAGLRRIWFPEHHTTSVVAPAPDILCAHVASGVRRIRVGAAGVLLRLHSPWAVAERWALLSQLAPNGLDLGIARGGVDQHRAAALRDGVRASSMDVFEGRVGALVSYLKGTIGPPLPTQPARGLEVWLHGRDHESAGIATRFALRYCHARFLGAPTPTPSLSSAVAVAGVCATSDAEAADWASSGLSAFAPALVADRRRWAEELTRLQAVEGISELVFVDLCRTPVQHLRSIALLAELVDAVPPDA